MVERVSCICLCKDTNFKANHNQQEVINGNYGVVYAYAKILILKQITTFGGSALDGVKLYMPMQRY